jgi:tRNA(Ile)-lysidine synthase
LRAFLRSRQGVWIEDPANANPLYERVRVRARLASLERAGLDPMRIARLGKDLRWLADVVDRDAAALIARAASFEADRIVVAPRQWSGGASARRRALSALIAAAAGAEREPAASAVERLEERLLDANFSGASLGGAGIAVVGHTIVLDRDRGALEGRADGARPMAPLALPSGVETVWDGRLLLKASGPGVSVWADPPAPRLVNDIEHDPPVAVETRWLLSERAAHALRVGVHDG